MRSKSRVCVVLALALAAAAVVPAPAATAAKGKRVTTTRSVPGFGAEVQQLAITCGTRAYRKARGHAVLIEEGEENAPARLRLKLIR